MFEPLTSTTLKNPAAAKNRKKLLSRQDSVITICHAIYFIQQTREINCKDILQISSKEN